ncbi:MAG: hotdog domain-containing protein [Melioribacteraceae bacterium]|nr:hotdog domain-containing protein [Melioribacteraceae bacterium]
MKVLTHNLAKPNLLGEPIYIETEKKAEVKLTCTEQMVVDKKGLIHGGFTYGLADYAAMLAINHPNVVLGSSKSRFIAPVKNGDTMTALAKVSESDGRRSVVNVDVHVGTKIVYSGEFTCYTLNNHVLE